MSAIILSCTLFNCIFPGIHIPISPKIHRMLSKIGHQFGRDFGLKYYHTPFLRVVNRSVLPVPPFVVQKRNNFQKVKSFRIYSVNLNSLIL